MKKKPSGRFLVTAGPTRERIDPVRFISNPSTGIMGYEIAKAARARGYNVTLISGPTNITPPRGVDFIPVESARQMWRAVLSRFKSSDCLFMASAVSDWRLAKTSSGKIKASGSVKSLKLVKNPDILHGAGRRKGRRILVGFALESRNLERNAKRKLRKKNLDIIAANKIDKERIPFGKGLTDVLAITKDGEETWLRRVTKKTVADYLVSKVEKLRQR